MAWLARFFGRKESPSLTPASSLVDAPTTASSVARITVGKCTSCGRDLRMKAHAVTSTVRLTCKCGAQNELAVSPDALALAGVEARRGRAETAYEDRPEVKLAVASAQRLLELYRANPEGFERSETTAAASEVRQIGRTLEDAGGMALMLQTHNEFRRHCNVLGGPRNLEIMWHGIGAWQG